MKKTILIAVIFAAAAIIAGCAGGAKTGRTAVPDVINTVIPDNFVRVQGGTFLMGTAEPKTSITTNEIRGTGFTMAQSVTVGGEDRERPVRRVTLRSFNIGKYPVTQKEWYEVMGTTVRTLQTASGGRFILFGESDDHPVYFVSWMDAIEYCNRRSLNEGLTPAYTISGRDVACDWDANGYRLPTEAEWEYAAKGGNKDKTVFLYSGSDRMNEVAWAALPRSERASQPVGKKAPNSLGLYDMSGNVWEWCWDWFADDYDYEGANEPDPRGAPAGSRRILRGGSWTSESWQVRNAHRFYAIPTLRYQDRGFRVVLP